MAAVIALWIGRRVTYFVTSFAALLLSQYIFWCTTPTDGNFLFWVALIGFCNGIFFGWLPFFLPELFETKVRATGAGVSFNFGRIVTATTIFLTPTLIATVVSFVVGYACIKWLMGFLQRRGIVPFVWYRFALGILIFAMCLTGRWDPNASIEATPNVPKEVASSR